MLSSTESFVPFAERQLTTDDDAAGCVAIVKQIVKFLEYVKPSLTRPEIIYCQDFVAFVELISVREHILILNMGF